MPKTLFDKIWDAHVVNHIPDGPDQLYIDRHYCHEVTSPQAFEGLRKRGLKIFRPERTFCSPDHNIPTIGQDKPISDPVSRHQVDTLRQNAADFGVTYFGIGHPKNGIIHVIGPENGLTLPGATIVCGDSHTSTHGAVGAVAFGIGTSEVEMVLASQCIIQNKPKTMRINVEGRLRPGVTAKDIALYIIARMSTGGATGYFVEYAGEAIRNLSMEERLTVCNLSIEMGARGGMIAPVGTGADDYVTKPFSPGELLARVKAHLDRYNRLIGGGMETQNEVITTGGLKIDRTARRVHVNGVEKSLTTKEFDLLYFLAKNPNRVFSKEELLQEVWEMDPVGADIATVTVHIKKIREKIEENSQSPRYIETVWSVGYRFII